MHKSHLLGDVSEGSQQDLPFSSDKTKVNTKLGTFNWYNVYFCSPILLCWPKNHENQLALAEKKNIFMAIFMHFAKSQIILLIVLMKLPLFAKPPRKSFE